MHAGRHGKQTDANGRADKRSTNTARAAVFFVCEDGACWWGRTVAGFPIAVIGRLVPFKTPVIVAKFFAEFFQSVPVLFAFLSVPRTKSVENRQGFEIKTRGPRQWRGD